MKNPHIGSNFDDFLEEENLLAESESAAIKRIIAFRITQLMQTEGISKKVMAERMKTSRASLDRLLNPSNESVTLLTLERAASALGKRLQIEFV